MKYFRKNDGITLIALVITIIVMLILVAVTIRIAVNGKLFEYAGKAVKETENAMKTENEIVDGRIKVGDKWYDSLDKYLEEEKSGSQGDGTTGEVIDVELQQGNYVDYHYKDDSGADAFIRCIFLGRVTVGWAYQHGEPIDTLFPLYCLEDLSFYPPSGNSTILNAEQKWKKLLCAEVTIDRSIRCWCVR